MIQQPTVAILYPGEMGAALARVLGAGGIRVISTLTDRSSRTTALSRESGVEAIRSWEEMARQAEVVLSVVSPAAAKQVAQRYCQVAHLAPPEALYVDLNSIGPDVAVRMAAGLSDAGIGFVDGSIHGQARALAAASGSVVYVSGPRADDLRAVLADVLPLNVVGEEPGLASLMKMLLGALSKGLCALFLETALLAERRGLPEFLDEAERFYPEMLSAVRRMLPSYPQHASRRASETEELERTARAAGQDPRLFGAVPGLLHEMGQLLFQTPAKQEWTVETLTQRLVARGFLASGTSVQAVASAATHREGEEESMDDKPRSADIHQGPGFRINLAANRLPPDLVQAFAQFPTPDISDLLNRLYAVSPDVHCLTSPEHRLCGPALTVKVFPGDNLMVHKALDVASPGDVVVVDAGSSPMNAVLGDLISTKARHRGIAGFVVDGMIRDLPGIQELGDFPVFARGATPIGPLHRGPGEINYPICCGGVVVDPGDIIVADQAGIVVVPKSITLELLDRLESQRKASAEYLESVRRGDFSNAWVDRTLEEQHCPVFGTGATPLSNS